MALNGILAGLVGITANADVVSVGSSIIIGAVAGVIVVFAITFLDKSKLMILLVRFPCGVCGIWGTLACAIFADFDFMVQLQELARKCICFIFAYVVFSVLKAVMEFVLVEEEDRGLDVPNMAKPTPAKPSFRHDLLILYQQNYYEIS